MIYRINNVYIQIVKNASIHDKNDIDKLFKCPTAIISIYYSLLFYNSDLLFVISSLI